MSLYSISNGSSQVSNCIINLCAGFLYCHRLKIKVTGMANLQTQTATIAVDKWTEIIEDLWKYLPHFQDKDVELYDDNCLKFDCVTLQFGDGEESESDSETWLHHNTSDMEESLVEVEDTKKKMSHDDCKLLS